MNPSKFLVSTPWDAQLFGINTFEIVVDSENKLSQVIKQVFSEKNTGHYTVKVNPLLSKKLLHDYGFYYCDTLIEPYCNTESFREFTKQDISLSESVSLEKFLEICHGAFVHGRFHRDFNLDKNLADTRYNSWLKQLYEQQRVWGLMYQDKLAGFWGFSRNKILLHALSQQYRGKGMAKYFWSLACQELFNQGYTELISSISAANVAVLNLYSSLGFKFRNPVDIYHLLLE